MSDRPTPETDAAWKEGNAIREWTCRKLERERDEAREERDKLKQLLFADAENVDAYLGACIERDEAREALRAVLELANDIPDESLDDWKIEFHKVLEEAK